MGYAIIVFGVLLVCMLAGIPVVFSIFLSSMSYLISSGTSLIIVGQKILAGINSFTLLAIPLFTCTGYLMEHTSLSPRLIDFVEAVLGKRRGGAGVVTIVSCAIFAALSGSGPATVAAIGAIMMPSLVRAGYSKSRSAGMIAAGGALGPIIPPSGNMIIYGATMGLSVSKMFMGGLLPGLIIALCLCGVNVFMAYKWKLPVSDKSFSAKEKLHCTVRALPTLALPVMILGGIYGGIVTPSEAAVLSVVYAVAYGLITKELDPKLIWTVFSKTCVTSATVGFIIAVASLFGYVMTTTRVPSMISAAVLSVVTNKYVYLAILMLILFVVGCLMETVASILILAPILVPIGIDLGCDPLHLGVLFCITLTVGFITPPFGINLFTAVSTTREPYTSILKGVFPYMIVMIIVVLVCAFVPQIITLIPGLMYAG